MGWSYFGLLAAAYGGRKGNREIIKGAYAVAYTNFALAFIAAATMVGAPKMPRASDLR